MTQKSYVVPSVDAYRAADPNGKRAMRRDAEAARVALVASIGADTKPETMARIAADIAAITARMAEWAPEPATASVDWTELRAIRGASLIAAGMAVMSGAARPSGMPDDIAADPIGWDVDGIAAWADSATVTRYATESLRRGTRRDLTAALVATVDGTASGTRWTYTELAHAVESAHPDYGTVSPGACRNAVEEGRIESLRHVARHGTVAAHAVRK